MISIRKRWDALVEKIQSIKKKFTMDWKLQIVRASNGYILRGKFGDTDIVSKYIIEISEKDNGELEAMQKLIWEIMEYFAVYYNKYNKKNLIVKIEENEE